MPDKKNQKIIITHFKHWTRVSNRHITLTGVVSNRNNVVSNRDITLLAVNNRKLLLMATCREPVGLALFALCSSMVYLWQQYTALWLINKNKKSRCMKPFLFTKMTISMCVSRKLLRMKSMMKQWKKSKFHTSSFLHSNVQALTQGDCNTRASLVRYWWTYLRGRVEYKELDHNSKRNMADGTIHKTISLREKRTTIPELKSIK